MGRGAGHVRRRRGARNGRPDRRGRQDPRVQPLSREGGGTVNEFINQLAFGWYPYLAVTVLVVGSILRFDASQYSWRSQSSQFLRRRQTVIGSNLFHMGILVLLAGHFVGLLTPVTVIDALGISHGFKQLAALVVGGIAGVAAYVGCTLLLHRRLFDPRIRRSSSIGDILVLVLIWLQLTLGILTTFWTM